MTLFLQIQPGHVPSFSDVLFLYLSSAYLFLMNFHLSTFSGPCEIVRSVPGVLLKYSTSGNGTNCFPGSFDAQ